MNNGNQVDLLINLALIPAYFFSAENKNSSEM